jgi:fructokinase
VIVVAGEALVDLIEAAGGADALTVVPGGGPYNAARTLARLGAPVAFLGRLSTDAFGEQLRAALVLDGVDVSLTVATADPTTLAVARLADDGSATYTFYLAGTSATGLVPDDIPVLPRDVEALHVGTLGLLVEPTAATVEALVSAQPREVLVLLDPNCRPAVPVDHAAYRARLERVLARADVVKVSREDLDYLFPEAADPVEAARTWLHAGPTVVLLTDGAAGVVVLTADGDTRVPAPDVVVVDTVGAGDAFGGGFLAAWTAQGLDRGDLRRTAEVVRCVSAAVAVAAVTCMRRGADPPLLGELASVAPEAAAVLSGIGGATG